MPEAVLAAFAPHAACASDFNGDGAVNSTDPSDFINDWFEDMAAGCGG